MAGRKARNILQRQLDARSKLWPDVTAKMIWERGNEGWTAVPRAMPLMMSIMDDLSGKGFPVSRTYFELWCRVMDERFLTLNRPEEMAFHAGFEGQRALRTWRDRVQRLVDLGFIGAKPGPLGDLSFVIFFNPYHVIKRHYLAGRVQERKWQSLVIRENEINAFDLDEIDENGNLIPAIEEDEDDQVDAPSKPKSAFRLANRALSQRRKKRGVEKS